MKKFILNDFIKNAESIHGDRYDYSLVKYNGSNVKVDIICKKHGVFQQTPYKHVNCGQGCPICAKENKCDTQKFIEKAKKIHGDKYDYSMVDYIDNKTEVCIICPIHGEFWQKPLYHLKGHGCSKCGGSDVKNSNIFVKEAQDVHGSTYDYSKVQYVNANTPVDIICKTHGVFKQTPHLHLRGCGCPKCGGSIRYDINSFIEKASAIHNNKYDYSKVVYKNSKTNVCITCPEHGDFFQKPEKHLKGCGCPKCSGQNLTTEEIIEKFITVHGNIYDYSKVIFSKKDSPVSIICKEHGEFSQTPECHLRGHGCYICGMLKNAKSRSLNNDEFIAKSKDFFGNKYGYTKVQYVNAKTPVIINCPEHGDFCITPDIHLYSKCGCPSCSKGSSIAEQEIIDYIKNDLNIKDVVIRNRQIIKPQELDILIPSKNISIEYNGLRWHSESFGKDKNYHLNKLNSCKKLNIGLIQIFEDEYINKKDIVLSKIKHILRCSNNEKIFARKCNIKEIDYDLSSKFLDINHIQGKCSSTIYLGSFYNDLLVGVMTFKRERKNSNKWELTRFATDINYDCIGLGGKMFKYFIKKYGPEEVKSFADRRWTIDENDNLYTKIGFKIEYNTKPDYRYYSPATGINRIHKFNMRKNKLIKDFGSDINDSESEMTKKLGFSKIWDCGLIKYVWKK